MSAGVISVAGWMPARDRNGRAVIGRVRVFQNQTNTPVPVYTTSALDVALSQPVETDDAGKYPVIWIDSAGGPVTLAFEQDDGQTKTFDGITASTSAAAALLEAYSGAISLVFDGGVTDSDPGAGTFRQNNSSIGSVTRLYIDNTSNGQSIAAFLDSLDDANASNDRGMLFFRSTSDAGRFAIFTVAGAVIDASAYRKVPVTHIAGPGFGEGEQVVLGFSARGATGMAGTDGADGTDGVDGTDGANGADGSDGWSPVFSIVSDGSRRVLQVSDWVGGQGGKPTTGQYVSASGLTGTIGSAVDIRGPAGANGSGTGDLLSANNLSDLSDLSVARNNLGVEIGADVQAYSANLQEYAAVNPTAAGLALLDDADAAAQRATLGLAIGTNVQAYDPNSAPVKGRQAIYIPAGAMVPRTTNGAASGSSETTTNKVMLKTLDFDASTIEYAQFQIRMPKQWNEGTVTFVPEWSHASTASNFKVSWGLQGVAISDDDAGDAAFGAAQFSNDTGGTTDDLYAGPESSAITIAGAPAAEDLAVFQVLRKADDATNDTLAIDARLLGITLYITTDAGNDA